MNLQILQIDNLHEVVVNSKYNSRVVVVCEGPVAACGRDETPYSFHHCLVSESTVCAFLLCF